MLFLLSPAKTLDFETPLPELPDSLPLWPERSARLVQALRGKSARQLGELMAISPALAELNQARFKDWRPEFTPLNSRQAVFAFDGDVYDGLQARGLRPADLAWAQRHLRILSGLHGLLRPMDRIQPYRLEMGTALPVGGDRNLYEYWRRPVADQLNAELAADATPVVVNLASQEYFRAVDPSRLRARVIECVFEEWKDGHWKVISFFAKKARGLMARHAILERVRTPGGLESFSLEGYRFAEQASAPGRLVFRRKMQG